MVVMKKCGGLIKNTKGYAVVEATILFPIIIMIFAGLVLLAMYLPTRSVLQRATQYAATAMATERSDDWLDFDTINMKYRWKYFADNVYAAIFSSFFSGSSEAEAEAIVKSIDGESVASKSGALTVECKVVNLVVYSEISVTATRTIPIPVDLSIVGFPTEIPVTVTSTAVVQNGDEFIRNVDIAAEYLDYLFEKYNLDFKQLGSWVQTAWDFLGI